MQVHPARSRLSALQPVLAFLFMIRTKHGDSSTPRSRRGKPLTIIAAMSLFSGMMMAAGTVVSAPPAEAVHATGGDGDYRESIDWFEWGADNSAIPAGGMTRTNSRIIAGKELATTCHLSDIQGGIRTYTPGRWRGDGLDDLYNIGGTDQDNQLVIGISNSVDGAVVKFNFSCSVTLDGVPVPLQGLVVADAEQIAPEGGSQVEYIQAKPDQPATWRIIDRYRDPACETETIAERFSDGTLRLRTGPGATCESGPVAVGFMEGATSAQVEMKGGGRSAVALGVVLQTDFGDAPISYGEAGAIMAPSWTGGELPEGDTPMFSGGFTLAHPGQPETRLGDTVDAESEYQASPDATGDDNNGNAVSDEDGVGPLGTIAATPGETFTLENVVCHGPGFIAGWIDWNSNGEFDEAERSTEVQCQGGYVDLNWEVPLDAVDSIEESSFLRLRIDQDSEEIALPTGMSTSGEVEDHNLNIELPRLEVTKVSNLTSGSRPGDTITYTVTATNASGAPFTSDYPATLLDDLSGVIDDATLDEQSISSDRSGDTGYTEPLMSWVGPLPAGDTVTLTYEVELTLEGDAQLRNVAWAPQEPFDPNDPPATPDCDEGDPRCAVVEGYTYRDFGDAPDSYGTTLVEGGPVHTVPGYNPATNTAPVMLGSRITAEEDGQPGPGADGDEGDDGVVFNPQLGYPNATLVRTGIDSTTNAPVENQIEVEVSADGFVSVWLDWDLDGTFDGPGERVLHSVPVTAGTNTLTFAQGENPDGVNTYARVRYSTDAEAISTPYGRAPDGEVEDYKILVERLNKPSVCEPTDTMYSLFEFKQGNLDQHGTGEVGSYTRYHDVAVVNGVPVDMVTELIAGEVNPSGLRTNGIGVGTFGAQIQANEDATVRYTFYEAGTNTPIEVNAVFVVSDMDGPSYIPGIPSANMTEIATFDLADLAGYSVSSDSTVIVEESGGQVTFTGQGNWDGEPQSRFEFRLENISTLDVRWQGGGNSGFGFKGNGDGQFEPACPNLEIEKTSDFTPDMKAGDTVTYTVTGTNTGTTAFTPTNPAIILDDLSGVLDDADLDEASVSASKPGTTDYTQPLVSWVGELDAGASVDLTYEVTIKDGGDLELKNVAWVSNPPYDPFNPPPTPDCVEGDPTCWYVVDHLPKLVKWKTVEADTDPVVAGTTLNYTLHFRNDGKASAEVNAVDDLSDVLDDADVILGAPDPSGPLDYSMADEKITITGSLEPDEYVTITYAAVVKPDGQRGNGVLDNCILDAGEDAPGDESDPDHPSCTSTPVSNEFLIEKRGQLLGSEGPIGGAEFAIFPDEGGVPGEDPAEAGVEGTGATGIFRVKGLPAGDYWLREVRAPEGHMLLAEDIPFAVEPSGEITLSSATDAIRVEHDGSGTWKIVVVDQEAFEMPLTGGSGNLPWILSGVLLAGAALVVPTLGGRGRRTYAVRV